MHRGVAAQPELLRKRSGPVSEVIVDADDEQFERQRPELGAGPRVSAGAQPAAAPRSGERSAALRVGQDARRGGRGRVPQRVGKLRAGLGDNELDQRRGVEVEDQRRCWATRSETEPVAFTRSRRERRGRVGAVIRPRRMRSSIASASPTADRRAIGRPRRVTITAAPNSTRSRCSLRRSWSSRTPTSYSRPCSVIGCKLAATWIGTRRVRGCSRGTSLGFHDLKELSPFRRLYSPRCRLR